MDSSTNSGRDTVASSPQSMLRLMKGVSSISTGTRSMLWGSHILRPLYSAKRRTCRMRHRKRWEEQFSMYTTALRSIMTQVTAMSARRSSKSSVSGCARKDATLSRVR